jgi:hypothetical protein
MMFLAAGEASGKIMGSSWDELIKTRIFAPLGMNSSTPTRDLSKLSNAAMPSGITGDSVYQKPYFSGTNIGPAGSIVSNAKDMAQWLRFQLADGTINGKRIIDAGAFHETHTPQIVAGAGGGGRSADSVVTNFSTYGMGWFIEDYRHQLMWQHGGNTDGMTTAVGMLPGKKFGVVVLSNMNGAQLPALIMRYIFDRELGVTPARDLSGEAYTRVAAQRRRADSVTAAQAGQPAAAKPVVTLADYVGTYADSLYGEATVSLNGNQLEFKRGDWHGPLEVLNSTNFRWTIFPSAPTGPMVIRFELGPDGKATGLYFGLGADATLLGRKAAPGAGRGGGRGGRP